MPTTIIYTRGSIQNGIIDLTATTADGRRLSSTLALSEIDSYDKLAAWLLAQTVPPRDDAPTIRRKLAITWHAEETIDPETGQTVTTRVIDAVTVTEPEEELRLAELLASPLATVSLAEANAAVDGLAIPTDAKVYLKKLNALVINMRDIQARALHLMKEAGLQ
jgi:hypothetical protein